MNDSYTANLSFRDNKSQCMTKAARVPQGWHYYIWTRCQSRF